MRSINSLIQLAHKKDISIPEAALCRDAKETGLTADEIRGKIRLRLTDMERSVREAAVNKAECNLVPHTGEKLLSYAEKDKGYSGGFIMRASAIALEVATYNASMGRIVAAPTAGSCGILPGLLFAWKEFYGKEDAEEKMTDALVTACAVGEVVAERATLAGAEGGCQAECGAAAAMGSAALVQLRGGSGEAMSNAVAITFKSVLGLVCDPVAGLVESPCIKRNGVLVASSAIAADMALAGIESIIPADEVIDTMGRVGRMIPPALRETSLGGLSITATAKRLVKDIKKKNLHDQ